MRDCRRFRDSLSAYVDAEVRGEELVALEGHLAGCARCREELSALRAMGASLRAMRRPEAPDLVPGIRARLEARPAAEPRRADWRWPAWLPAHGLALAAAGALLVAVISLPGLFDTSQPRRTSAVGLLGRSADDDTARDRPASPAPDAPAEVPALQRRQAAFAGPGGDRLALSDAQAESEQVLRSAVIEDAAKMEIAEYGEQAGKPDHGAVRHMPVAPQTTETDARASAAAQAANLDEAREMKQAQTRDDIGGRRAGASVRLRWPVRDVASVSEGIGRWVREAGGDVRAGASGSMLVRLPSPKAVEFLRRFVSLNLQMAVPTYRAGEEEHWVRASPLDVIRELGLAVPADAPMPPDTGWVELNVILLPRGAQQPATSNQ